MKPRTQKETIKRMGTLLGSWIKRFFNAMMEASARYHEAQTKQPAHKTRKSANPTKYKATREKSPEVFDRRSL